MLGQTSRVNHSKQSSYIHTYTNPEISIVFVVTERLHLTTNTLNVKHFTFTNKIYIPNLITAEVLLSSKLQFTTKTQNIHLNHMDTTDRGLSHPLGPRAVVNLWVQCLFISIKS